MSWTEEIDSTLYNVLVNHAEQYTYWPKDRELPMGWKETGFHGNKQACLDYIEEVWTDMQPLDIRKKMKE
jgi:MbtH protein